VSQIDTLATAIETDLDLVTDVGVTYDHGLLPTTNDWADFIAAFTVVVAGQRQVRAWTIQYLSEKRRYRTLGSEKVLREITFMIRAHLSMTATSEKVFRGLLESAVTELDSDPDLGGSCIDHDACDVSVPDNGAGLFLGDILCHYGEITLVARVEQTL
jgi:hypothetical protein